MAFVEESGSSIQLDTIMAPEKPTAPDREFPEGGIRAWLVVLGAYCVSFSTFGYMNAFGYDISLLQRLSHLRNCH